MCDLLRPNLAGGVGAGAELSAHPSPTPCYFKIPGLNIMRCSSTVILTQIDNSVSSLDIELAELRHFPCERPVSRSKAMVPKPWACPGKDAQTYQVPNKPATNSHSII